MRRLLILLSILAFALAASPVAAAKPGPAMTVTLSLSDETPLPGPPLRIDVVRSGGTARTAQDVRVGTHLVTGYSSEFNSYGSHSIIWDNGNRVTGHIDLTVVNGWPYSCNIALLPGEICPAENRVGQPFQSLTAHAFLVTDHSTVSNVLLVE